MAKLHKPFLIICEGAADRKFVRHLLEVRGIGDEFEVVGHKEELGSGNSTFGAYISGLETERGFSDVEAILIVTDGDTDPDASFRAVQDQFRDIGYVVPDAPLDIVRTIGKPALTVILIPFDNSAGNLESYIGDAMEQVWNPESISANEHINRTDAAGWSFPKRAKAAMQCMIAVLHEPDPNNSLTYIWSNNAGFRDLLNHATFDDLTEFLRGFPTRLRLR